MNTLKRHFWQVFHLACFLTAVLLGAEVLPLIDIWSGREQSLAVPEGATWALVAEHGRELFSGSSQGEAAVNLPALAPGAQTSLSLFINGRKEARVRIWSPEILAGLMVKFAEPEGRLTMELRKHGLKTLAAAEICVVEGADGDEQAAVTLCFPAERDFPVPISADWQEISLHHTKKGGCLSVLYDKREQVADCSGNLGYVRLQKEKRRCYLFSPDFDLHSIDNVLLLKTILEEKKP